MKSFILVLFFITCANAIAESSLSKDVCRQNPSASGCVKTPAPQMSPRPPEERALDIADQYKQQQFNRRYQRVLKFKACQPAPGTLDPTQPEACLMAMSNFERVCPQGQYLIQGNGATRYRELSLVLVEDFIFRYEAEGRIAYIVKYDKTLVRVQANQYAEPGVGSYGDRCVFPSPDDYMYKDYRGDGYTVTRYCRLHYLIPDFSFKESSDQ